MDTQTETTEDTADVAVEEATTEVAAEPRETPAAPVERQTRRDRKRERVDVEAAHRERDEVRRQLESERSEREKMSREVAELRGRMEERERLGQQQSKSDELKVKVNTVRNQAWTMMERAATAKTPEESRQFRDEYQRLMDEADDLRDEQRDAARWEKRRGEIASSMPNPTAQADMAWLSATYPWLPSNEDAQVLADSRIKLLTQKGRPLNRETVAEAIAWAAKQLKIGGHTAATNGQRQLYAGIPSGETAGGDDRPRSIKMGRHEEALARATYPNLEAKDAYKQWARDMVERQNDDE